MTSPKRSYGFDKDYLRRSKESTPEQKLSWLAAAREFVLMTSNAKKKKEKKR